MTRLELINQRLAAVHAIVNDETPMAAPTSWQVGIDLGTADIQTVVVDGDGNPIAAFLDWANVVNDGIVVDYFGACQIVRAHLEKVENKLGISVDTATTSYPPGTDPQISINVVEAAGVEVKKVIDEPTSVARMLGISDGAVVDIGGGTTGTAIIEQGQLIASLDEPSGGRHVTLVIAGRMKVDTDEADRIKRTSHQDQQVALMAKPVIEKMADIVKGHLGSHCPTAIYLTGGGTLVAGVADVFKQTLPRTKIVEFPHALYLTPLAIASATLSSSSPSVALGSSETSVSEQHGSARE